MAEYFKGIPQHIEYKGPQSRDPLSFRFYNPDEVVLGRPMREWLRFSVVYWHTFRASGADPFGAPTMVREWDDGSATVENAKRRLRVAFEFMRRLGVEYWAFHDRDIAPEGATLAETNAALDEVAAEAEEQQRATGIKLLWGTANLFGHPRYMNGAATSPSAEVFAHGAAQVKKAMEVTKRLGGAGYVFWGGREGYQSTLNTDMALEKRNLATFLRMAAEHKRKIGFGGQLLIEPKPREPTKHQYDYDADTVLGFLRAHGLLDDFALNIEPNHTTLAGHDYEHDIIVAHLAGKLGSIDANTGDPLLGWDTDQFIPELRKAVQVMLCVLRQGGLAPGGLNFDCKVRRESTALDDLFIAHISAMDQWAHALRIAAQLQADKALQSLIDERYASYNSGIGKKIKDGQTSFEELEKYALEHKDAKATSAKQELFELTLNRYL
eukprot:m51a1_g7379 putative xylose isomerase (438) ;mRNA; r:94245-95875